MYTLPKKFCPMVWHARSLLVVRRCWVNCRLSRCERRWLQLPATELLPRFYRAPTFYQPLPAKTALQRSKADQRCRRKGKKKDSYCRALCGTISPFIKIAHLRMGQGVAEGTKPKDNLTQPIQKIGSVTLNCVCMLSSALLSTVQYCSRI